MKDRWIALYVENQVGVLAKISGLFAGKSYNMKSLTVGTTENEDTSRMTICAVCDDITFEQIKKCSEDDLAEAFRIAQVFKVDVADIGEDSVLLECKLTEHRNNELIALLRSRFKNIEIVRGGAVAIESISTSCR